MGRQSKYDLVKARELYMSYKTLKEIAEALDMPYKTVQFHSAKWKKDRDLMKNELLRELTENKKTVLTSLVGNSLECVDRAIADLKNRKNPPSIKEARMLTHIVSEIDKILRLDEGEPTDIIAEHKPATIIELREKLKRDPFYIEDANFREIAYEETITNSTNDSTNGDGGDAAGSSDSDSSGE
tara:strand:+ start:851 stop:1402 length:552 start_codon:yes stop_codon:yes gene_type:complete